MTKYASQKNLIYILIIAIVLLIYVYAYIWLYIAAKLDILLLLSFTFSELIYKYLSNAINPINVNFATWINFDSKCLAS